MKYNGRYPLLLLLLLLLSAAGAKAQANTAVSVSDAQIIEGPENIALTVYFSLQSDQPSLQPATQAAILLEDGSLAPAQIEKAPFYIVLVLDASGSMATVIDDIRQAAIDLVTEAPPETHFAVMRFNESIDLLQPFTNDPNQVIQAINRVEIDDSGTCLYDVAYTAVQSLDQIARNTPRRALVLFTDGNDERRRGLGDTCSRNTYDQLVSLATNRRLPIPIHTVGLAENVAQLNSADLSNLAQATGARSAVGNDETLAQLYDEIMIDVRRQWLARAQLQPGQGFHRGILLLNDTAHSPLPSAPISFFANRSYIAPAPEPVTIDIRNFIYDQTADLYLFDVPLTGFEQVSHLQIELIDEQNNVQVMTFMQNNLWYTQQIRLITRNLIAEQLYRVVVTPFATAVTPNQNELGTPLSADHIFRYDPPKPLYFAIDGVQVIDAPPIFNLRTMQIEDDEPQFVVDLFIENGERINHYEAILLDRLSGQQTSNFPLSVNADKMAHMAFTAPGGAYTLIVNALAEDGLRLATADYQFIYTPPTSVWANTWHTLRSTPLLILLFLILLLLAIFLSWLIAYAIGKRRGARQRKPQPIHEPALPAPQTIYMQVTESPDGSLLVADPVEITKFPYTIGREGADLSIRGDQHISRKHARISLTAGAFYIEDLGSSNHTFIDGAQIPARDPIALNVLRGTQVRVGKTTTLSLTAVANNGHPRNTGQTVASESDG